jgi:hypothetical protein
MAAVPITWPEKTRELHNHHVDSTPRLCIARGARHTRTWRRRNWVRRVPTGSRPGDCPASPTSWADDSARSRSPNGCSEALHSQPSRKAG